MNIIVIKGRLTRDPELKTAGNGTEYCKFSVAVDRRMGKDKDKEKVADFFDCTAFGNTGVAISKYFTKGKEILVSGRMESNRVAKDDTVRIYWGIAVETFDFCGSKSDSAPAGNSAPAPVDASSGMEKVDTEELPF